MVLQLRRCAFERQAFDARHVARLVCRRPEGCRAVMNRLQPLSLDSIYREENDIGGLRVREDLSVSDERVRILVSSGERKRMPHEASTLMLVQDLHPR